MFAIFNLERPLHQLKTFPIYTCHKSQTVRALWLCTLDKQYMKTKAQTYYAPVIQSYIYH